MLSDEELAQEPAHIQRLILTRRARKHQAWMTGAIGGSPKASYQTKTEKDKVGVS